MMLAAPDAGWRMAWPVLGTYLLACGAAALNQVQERKCDARMERTKHRPLPAGAMSVGTAAVIGVVLVAAGLGMLAVTGRVVTVALGVTAVLSYNALYTPLKRVTPWAPVIGAVVGAFAPAIGWTGVSGETFSPALVGLTVFFVVWQIPHFWLLFLRLEREFAAAGLPVLSARFGPDGLKRVTFVWTLASAALGLSLPLFGAVRHPGLVALLVGTALWLGWRVRGVLSDDEPRSLCRAFVAINAFAVVLLTTIILGKWN
jgi:protoheme IX farnesyltransferase